jgi:hypothetical protein
MTERARRPLQIHIDHPGVIGQRNVFEAAERAHAGVVDPHVDAPEPRECSAPEAFDLCRIAHVRRYDERSACGCECEWLHQFGATGGHYYVVTVRQKLGGNPFTESTRCAGDHDRARGLVPSAGCAPGDHHENEEKRESGGGHFESFE